jgi:hypothetical protein
MTIKMQTEFVDFVRRLARTEINDNGQDAKRKLAEAVTHAKLLDEAYARSVR